MVLLIVPPIAAAVIDARARVPNRFAEVETGRLYRGGYPTSDQLQSMASRYDIKTIINLTAARGEANQPASSGAAEELDAAKR